MWPVPESRSTRSGGSRTEPAPRAVKERTASPIFLAKGAGPVISEH